MKLSTNKLTALAIFWLFVALITIGIYMLDYLPECNTSLNKGEVVKIRGLGVKGVIVEKQCTYYRVLNENGNSYYIQEDLLEK